MSLVNGLTPKKALACKTAGDLAAAVHGCFDQGKIYDEDYLQLVKDATWNATLAVHGRDYWTKGEVAAAVEKMLEAHFAGKQPNPRPAEEDQPAAAPAFDDDAAEEMASVVFDKFQAKVAAAQKTAPTGMDRKTMLQVAERLGLQIDKNKISNADLLAAITTASNTVIG